MKKIGILFCLAHVIHLLFIALGMTGCIPNGVFEEPDAQPIEYALTMAAVVQVLVCVPLAVVWGKKHSLLPLGLLTGVVDYSLLCYYLTLSSTGLLCAAIAYLTLCYAYATTLRHHRQL